MITDSSIKYSRGEIKTKKTDMSLGLEENGSTKYGGLERRKSTPMYVVD